MIAPRYLGRNFATTTSDANPNTAIRRNSTLATNYHISFLTIAEEAILNRKLKNLYRTNGLINTKFRADRYVPELASLYSVPWGSHEECQKSVRFYC